MAKKKIETVETVTKGGHNAVITAVDCKDVDCFFGEVEVKIGDKDFTWDINGICRDNNEAFDLNCQAQEIKSLIEIVEKQRN